MEWPAPLPSGVELLEYQLEEQVMRIAVLGIDLGKNVCGLVGFDENGAVVMRRRARRDLLVDFVVKLPPCTIGMEACCGAHHLGRLFTATGHDVRLMSPEYVRPYVSHPGRLYGCFLNSSGLILYQSFMACNGDLLPRADCGSCWL